MRFVRLSWITKGPGRAWVGSVPNKHNPSTKSGQDACISSRITMVIHVMNDHQINDNCFNEPFAVSPCRSLYWDMHGLIFETSIWLLAGSTRFVYYDPKLRKQSDFNTVKGHCQGRFINPIEHLEKIDSQTVNLKGASGINLETITLRQYRIKLNVLKTLDSIRQLLEAKLTLFTFPY